MGICGTNKIKKDITINANDTGSNLNTEFGEEFNYLFHDMPEWEGEKYKGEGVKRMKGYKCNIPIDELIKLREQYWNLKIKSNPVWKCLKQACTMDDIRASSILISIGLKPVNGNISHLKDDKGHFYKIPNFCINDPYFEKIYVEDDENVMHEEKQLKFFIYDLYNNKKLSINVFDTLTGKELKKLICETENIKSEDFIIRLFFGGAEIKDEHKLYKHKIKSDFTVQVMRWPIIKEKLLIQ